MAKLDYEPVRPRPRWWRAAVDNGTAAFVVLLVVIAGYWIAVAFSSLFG